MNLLPDYEAGRRARAEGALATDNPHLDWPRAVAWAAGWHHLTLQDCVEPARALEGQTAEVAGEIWC